MNKKDYVICFLSFGWQTVAVFAEICLGTVRRVSQRCFESHCSSKMNRTFFARSILKSQFLFFLPKRSITVNFREESLSPRALIICLQKWRPVKWRPVVSEKRSGESTHMRAESKGDASSLWESKSGRVYAGKGVEWSAARKEMPLFKLSRL